MGRYRWIQGLAFVVVFMIFQPAGAEPESPPLFITVDGVMWEWREDTESLNPLPEDGYVRDLAISPDGTLLAYVVLFAHDTYDPTFPADVLVRDIPTGAVAVPTDSPVLAPEMCPALASERVIPADREPNWLDPADFARYLNEINVDSAVVPPGLGRSLLAVDWDAATGIADQGRMVAIGFEAFYGHGTAWGSGTMVYATYDFAIGSEYDMDAQPQDYEALRTGQISPERIVETVDHTRGYITYRWHPFFQLIKKTIVFPFPTYYVVVDYFLDGDYADNYPAVIDDLYRGLYPEDERCFLGLMDSLADSLTFADDQFPG